MSIYMRWPLGLKSPPIDIALSTYFLVVYAVGEIEIFHVNLHWEADCALCAAESLKS